MLTTYKVASQSTPGRVFRGFRLAAFKHAIECWRTQSGEPWFDLSGSYGWYHLGFVTFHVS